MKRALVALNGEPNISIEKTLAYGPYDIIVGVDGGNMLLNHLGLLPHVVVGDFDSAELEGVMARVPQAHALTFNSEKDFTDSELAIQYLIDEAVESIVVIGGLGGRMDHFLGNIGLFEMTNRLVFIDENHEITLMVGPDQKHIANDYEFVSLVPFSDCVKGIDLIGFKYPLDQATIKRGQTIGISNEVLSSLATIRITSGKVMVFRVNEM